MSKKEFALYFCKLVNLNTKNIIGNSQKDVNLLAKRPNDMRLNSQKIRKQVGNKIYKFER